MKFIKITPFVSIQLGSVAQFAVEPKLGFVAEGLYSFLAVELGSNRGVEILAGPQELCVALHEKLLEWIATDSIIFDVREVLDSIVGEFGFQRDSDVEVKEMAALGVSGPAGEDSPIRITLVFDETKVGGKLLIIMDWEEGRVGAAVKINSEVMDELHNASIAAINGEKDTVLRYGSEEDKIEVVVTFYRAGSNPTCGIIEVIGDEDFSIELFPKWIEVIRDWTETVINYLKKAV